MRRIGFVVAALAAALALPGASQAKPQSFRAWSVSWSALTARDNDRVINRCQKLYGQNDLKFGMCYVKAGHANLTAERKLWERQMAAVTRGQPAPCRKAIATYMSVARLRQSASLMYLESHGETPLSRIASDIGAAPYSTLKTMNDRARRARSRSATRPAARFVLGERRPGRDSSESSTKQAAGYDASSSRRSTDRSKSSSCSEMIASMISRSTRWYS